VYWPFKRIYHYFIQIFNNTCPISNCQKVQNSSLLDVMLCCWVSCSWCFKGTTNLWNVRSNSSSDRASLSRRLESSVHCCQYLKSHIARTYFSSTRQRLVDMSYIDPDSLLHKELWPLIRTQQFEEYFLTILKHHMKILNLRYSWNWSTYTAAMELGLNSNSAICLTSVSS
jgi:hypothetical protein